MADRLTERDLIGAFVLTIDGKTSDGPVRGAVIDKLADYEDAEEQGRLEWPVHCRDCVYGRKWLLNTISCDLHSDKQDFIVAESDYCSRGERRAEKGG